MSPSKTPGGRHAIKAGRTKYLAERERYRAKRDRRLAEMSQIEEIATGATNEGDADA